LKQEIFTKKVRINIVATSFLVLIIVGWIQYNYQYSHLKNKFHGKIENVIKQQLMNDLGSIKGIISSLSSYYQSTTEMNSSVFSTLSNGLLDNYRYIEAIIFLTIVKDEEKEIFEEDMREDGHYNFSINTINKNRTILKSTEIKSKYAPIIYIEPSNYYLTKYYGLDLYNTMTFKSSFDEASKTGNVIIKDNIVMDNLGKEMTFFIKPTYKNITRLDTEKKRIENTNGFYLIAINIEKLFSDIKEKFPDFNITTTKYDSTIENKAQSVFFDELYFFEKISDLERSYIYITKQLYLNDYNLVSFVLILFITMVIQALLVVIWYINESSKITLHYKATHDDLTTLANRTYFKEQFNKKINNFNNTNNKFIAVLFIDIDNFKDINDSFGHKFGDEVLIKVSKKFKTTLSNQILISRNGGDEFLILMDGRNNIESIVDLINEIMELISQPITLKSYNLHLTVSIGVSLYPNDGNNIDDLLKNADAAMYIAKDDGRNTFKFYQKNMTEELMEKLLLQNELKDAIQNDEFTLNYQPQFDGRNDKLVGMEVLVRWTNKNGNTVAPVKFIPLAEQTGLIINLDRLVMKKAIKQFAEWKNQNFNTGRLSINLSIKQLKTEDFLEIFKELLTRYNVNPRDIELEVTEGALMDNPLDAIAKLDDLSNFGINLSVDDFGTGYSSLAYLKKLPISKLKIDKSFVDGLPDHNDDVAIVKSIIALAKSLNLDVIAEGVENIQQREFLVANGCNKIQGYFYAKPLKKEEIELVF